MKNFLIYIFLILSSSSSIASGCSASNSNANLGAYNYNAGNNLIFYFNSINCSQEQTNVALHAKNATSLIELKNGSDSISVQLYTDDGLTTVCTSGCGSNIVGNTTIPVPGTISGILKVSPYLNVTNGVYTGVIPFDIAYSCGGSNCYNTVYLNVSLMVNPSCSINNANLSFGTYNPLNDNYASVNIYSNCTNTLSYKIKASSGNGTINQRKMKKDSDLLNYNLYIDNSYSIILGDDSSGSPIVSNGSGNTQSNTIYGKIPSGQLVTPGRYSDVIIITVVY